MVGCQTVRKQINMKRYYHNPACSKSREALALLQEANIDVQVIEYLQQGLQSDEVLALAQALQLPVSVLVRRPETIPETWTNLSLQDDVAWAAVLVAEPKLLQRPILCWQNHAVIARPPQLVLSWLVEQGHEKA